MKRIELLPLGDIGRPQLEDLAKSLSRELRCTCEVLGGALDISPSLNASRGQYHSTQILARMGAQAPRSTNRLLGIADVDLYIPILTFVFGEAQLNGRLAVVSTHRLRQEFYGLPASKDLLKKRLLKEAVHELGHTFGLTHCDDTECAMAPSHAVEWIDLKTSHFCSKCAAVLARAALP